MALSAAEKKHFRGIGHRLRPIVMVGGQGLTPAVLAELERALEAHELIKLKVAAEDRETRRALIAALIGACGGELVHTIGNVALVHRAAKKPDPRLSNLIRFAGAR